MATFSRHNLVRTISDMTVRFRHAFAVTAEGQPLSGEDLALLERVADAVVRRGMAEPAVLFLESMGPMNFLGSQALYFFTPFLEIVFPQREIEQVARLLEQRDALLRLAAIIERRADADRDAKANRR